MRDELLRQKQMGAQRHAAAARESLRCARCRTHTVSYFYSEHANMGVIHGTLEITFSSS